MSHTSRCIRSDGDWICTSDCTHDRDEARATEHALACAVADAWLIEKRADVAPIAVLDDGFLSALDALEIATRGSPFRKVDLDQEIALERAISASIGPDGRLDMMKLICHPTVLGRLSERVEEQRNSLRKVKP